jgi:hypothetical protein
LGRIDYKTVKHVVILSVVGTGHFVAEVDLGLASKLGVTAVATVPQTLLKALIGMGGSALDLVTLLGRLRGLGEVEEPDALSILRRYRRECHEASTQKVLDAGLPGYPEEALAARAAQVLLSLTKSRHRHIPSAGKPLLAMQTGDTGGEFGVFNDIDLTDLLAIAKTIAAGSRLSEVHGLICEIPLRLSHYDCGICVVPFAQDMGEAKKAHERWTEERKEGTMRPGPNLAYVVEKHHLFVHATPRQGPGRMEQLLDGFPRPMTPPAS